MQERISAIIIDKHADLHDYSPKVLNSNWCCPMDWQEKEFNVLVLKDADRLMEKVAGFKDPDSIVTVGEDAPDLSWMSFEWRKRWVWLKEYNVAKVSNAIVSTFMYNICRPNYENNPVFSFFTSTYNTPIWQVDRLRQSLSAQTYPNWNWWVIDDSRDEERSPVNHILGYKDPRIHIIRNFTDHGVIGFNKHMVAMAADGDFLVEIDHDDEADPHLLECLYKAVRQFPDAGFLYTDCLELYDGDTRAAWYGEGIDCGMAIVPEYGKAIYNGVEFNEFLTFDINAKSIRTIYYQPNHARVWKRDLYHKVGGHATNLSVLDDMDLIIRTFLAGATMVKVPKCLYYQHLGGSTQAVRNREIQRVCALLYSKYDRQVHEKLLEMGYEDPDWDEESGCSNIYAKHMHQSELKAISKTAML